MDIFSKKTYLAIVLVTCVLAFAIGAYKTWQGSRYVSLRPPLPIAAPSNNLPRAKNSENDTEIDVQNKPIILRGDEKLVVENRHYLVGETITLKDNATFVIRNSTFEHKSALGKKITLNAYGKSKVVLENSILAVSCDEIASWNFHDDASLVAHGVQTTDAGCFPRQKFLNSARADIASWDVADIIICDNANIAITDSKKLLIDLCLPVSARVDEALPEQTTAAYIFPNENELGISFSLSLSNASVGKWNVRIMPRADITIRDANNIEIGIHAQKPWEEKILSFEDLTSGLFENRLWKIIDAKIHLLNTSVQAWDFFLEHTNELQLEKSVARSITASEDTAVRLQNSTVESIQMKDFAEATFQNSHLESIANTFDKSKITFIDSTIGKSSGKSTLAATDKSVITLTHTVSNATIIEEAEGRIVVQ